MKIKNIIKQNYVDKRGYIQSRPNWHAYHNRDLSFEVLTTRTMNYRLKERFVYHGNLHGKFDSFVE